VEVSPTVVAAALFVGAAFAPAANFASRAEGARVGSRAVEKGGGATAKRGDAQGIRADLVVSARVVALPTMRRSGDDGNAFTMAARVAVDGAARIAGDFSSGAVASVTTAAAGAPDASASTARPAGAGTAAAGTAAA
jgi:hypothetical protein